MSSATRPDTSGQLPARYPPAAGSSGTPLVPVVQRKIETSRDRGLRALAVAAGFGNRPLIAAASSAVALACAFEGETAEAENHRTKAVTLIDAMSDDELVVRLDATAYLTAAEAYLDRFVDSVRHGERGMALARATGQGELLPILIQALGTSLLTRGELGEAADLLDGSIEAARLVGHEQTLAWSLLNRAFVAVHQGTLDVANATIGESLQLTRSLDDSMVSTYSGVIMAVVHTTAANHAGAVDCFVRSAGGEHLPLISGGWRAKYLELLTRCQLALGRRDDAERTAGYADAVAAKTGLPMARVWAQRARAEILLDAGQAAGAAEVALASAATCDATRAPIEAASSRLIAGRALRKSGNEAGAVVELEQAAAVLEELGADRFRLEVERELRTLGRSVRRRSRPASGRGVASLTGRELELAHLVVDRKTNPEIAGALFLSQKTVEAHLTNIFRKLRVNSRVELARAVERAEHS